jgi:hypothetical protein
LGTLFEYAFFLYLIRTQNITMSYSISCFLSLQNPFGLLSEKQSILRKDRIFHSTGWLAVSICILLAIVLVIFQSPFLAGIFAGSAVAVAVWTVRTHIALQADANRLSSLTQVIDRITSGFTEVELLHPVEGCRVDIVSLSGGFIIRVSEVGSQTPIFYCINQYFRFFDSDGKIIPVENESQNHKLLREQVPLTSLLTVTEVKV